MSDILHEIILNKRREMIARKEELPFDQLIARLARINKSERSLRRALEQSPTGIIAEFKRRSPSKGWINPNAQVANVVEGYERAGAAACSILTDHNYFGGSITDLIKAREAVTLPLLRKEFIIDSYQIYEAALFGADAILLIAACLSAEECYILARLAHCLGMEVLLEIHNESELDRLNPCVDLLGVNNRHLGTFHTDVETSFRLARLMALHAERMEQQPLLISESGLSDPTILTKLRQAGFRGFLMGEAFMRTDNPAKTLERMV